MPNNQQFLEAIFGVSAPFVHVTDFVHDPGNIPANEQMRSWRGNYFGQYNFQNISNQYFTISLFDADECGDARRRKSLFKCTPCVVLDDVKEKLDMIEVNKLPRPSWILETSPGSEQWGYILDTPCHNIGMVENLLDGLVANGLAPDGQDPGMKGVTRYVRLPDGYNLKAKKMVNGQPFKCRMLEWSPERKCTIDQLAAPFCVDLNRPRRSSRVDGAAEVSDHPLLQIPGVIRVKEVRSAGRYDITCPWVDDHTGGVDSGSAIFTNDDGSLGFKCHHGHCQERTGADLLRYIDHQVPGFSQNYNMWVAQRAFKGLVAGAPSPAPDFSVPAAPAQTVSPSSNIVSSAAPSYKSLISDLRMLEPGEQQQDAAEALLKALEKVPSIKQVALHKDVKDVMGWTSREFDLILKDCRTRWYSEESNKDIDFYDNILFIGESNQFFHRKKRIWYTPEAYQNNYNHLREEARKEALQGGRVMKVDRIDYAPLKPGVFEEGGIIYGNAWHAEDEVEGVEGDASPWLDHIDLLGWGEYKDHILKYMAFTLKHPDQKINHMMVFGSEEGCGKDWLLYPLMQAMGVNAKVINGEELLEPFNDYILSTKYLHVNEAELGNRKEAQAVSAKLKPLAAAPPDKLRINEKFVKKVEVRNLLSITMTTNSRMPFRLDGPSRRIFAVWSDVDPRDSDGQLLPEWAEYWTDHWKWMKGDGYKHCIWYLRNCVDLSDFNPGLSPPVTTFLRDILGSSMSPLEQTFRAMIQKKIGCFRHDLVTSYAVIAELKVAETVRSDYVYIRPGSRITPENVIDALRKIGGVRFNVGDYQGYESVWAVRNFQKYKEMRQCDVVKAYREMGEEVKNNPPHFFAVK